MQNLENKFCAKETEKTIVQKIKPGEKQPVPPASYFVWAMHYVLEKNISADFALKWKREIVILCLEKLS